MNSGGIRSLGSLPVSVEDWGGAGQEVLLLHGSGRDKAEWAPFAALLAREGFRPIAMDLRGHGASGQGPWSWTAVLGDVTDAVDSLGLREPIVIGNSLGGIVAALWAGEHPECPLAVDVAGQGHPARLGLMSGLAPKAEVALTQLRAELDSLGDGLTPWFLTVMRHVDEFDVMAAYRAARCPLLVVTGDQVDQFALLFGEPGATAWRAGCAALREQLDAAAADDPLIQWVELPAGHDVHLEAPYGLLRVLLEQPTFVTRR